MRIILVLVVAVLGFLAAIAIASETGGEVVVLTTADEREVEFQTSLWIVEYRGSAYLRAGSTDSAWYKRLVASPVVTLERRGQRLRFRAVPDPAATGTINGLMARDYGLADQLISLMRDESQSMAVRLERISAEES